MIFKREEYYTALFQTAGRIPILYTSAVFLFYARAVYWVFNEEIQPGICLSGRIITKANTGIKKNLVNRM